MAKLSDVQIEDKLKDIENKIKNQNDVYRADIQEIINRIIYNVESLPELEEQIKRLIVDRAKIKKFGLKTFYQPRAGREDLYEEDITLKFIRKGELINFLKVKDRFNIA